MRLNDDGLSKPLRDATSATDNCDPLLASSTDGVGTELAVAQVMDKHDTVELGEVVSSKRSRRLECSAAPGRCCFLGPRLYVLVGGAQLF